jgi:hypothetical protein
MSILLPHDHSTSRGNVQISLQSTDFKYEVSYIKNDYFPTTFRHLSVADKHLDTKHWNIGS